MIKNSIKNEANIEDTLYYYLNDKILKRENYTDFEINGILRIILENY